MHKFELLVCFPPHLAFTHLGDPGVASLDDAMFSGES